MNEKSIPYQIIELKNADLALRDKLMQAGQLSDGYNEEMAQLHNSNAERLNEMIDTIGYPSVDKVGKEASEAAWLVIQHAIGNPNFMRKCAQLLATAIAENNANPMSLAYLTDRIASFEGKPQAYGTQFDWDENGELSPNVFDDLALVNQRRKALGLNTLEAQTLIIRRQAMAENEKPPIDFAKRRAAFNEWRKKVGWVE